MLLKLNGLVLLVYCKKSNGSKTISQAKWLNKYKEKALT